MRWLLNLYPLAWRNRYEEEILAVLEEHKVTPRTIIDLLIGALDANLNYNSLTEGAENMVNQLRFRLIMVFCAFITFGIGWGTLQRLTDPIMTFQPVASSHPALTILFDAILIVGFLAFIMFLIGGIPIFFVAIRRAFKNKQRNILVPFRIAVSSLLLFILSTGILASWHQIAFMQNHFLTIFLCYLTIVAICLITGTVSVSLVLAKTDFQLKELKFIFVPEVVILFGMAVSVILSIILIILITIRAPQLFATQDVGSSMFITGISFMALGMIFAVIGMKRKPSTQLL
jgi:hypothetical protein